MDIPHYPDVRALTLEDKPLLDQRFRLMNPKVSELTFANLYLFRNAHSYRLTLVNNIPVILGMGYGGEPYFLPPVDESPIPAVNALLKQGMTLYGADEDFLARFVIKGDFAVAEDRDNFDYLYLREDLSELRGSRYHKKKNRINYLLKRVDVGIEKFSDAHAEGALRLLAEWRKVKAQEEKASLLLEVDAAAEALRLHRELGLQGVTALVDGEVKGFALGERLNSDTSVCHFEKADPFMEGLPQLINREFNKYLFTDCTYVNREQDLGDPGLRTAKLSYHPVDLVRKHRVTLTRR